MTAATHEGFQYQANDRWAQVPSGWSWNEVTAVAVDSRDRVLVFNRGEHPVLVFERDGTFITSWGEGQFARPHGITIGPCDSVYCTDDLDHTVRKFTPEGKLLFTLGTSGRPSNTGATSIDYRTIKYAGEPLYFPTNVALSPYGEIYVSDGYGNARIHKFDPDGRLLFSWGNPGSGPGEFQVPHGIAVDRTGTVYVADRENSRIQLLSPDGQFLSERTGIARPCQVAFDVAENLYVAELGVSSGDVARHDSSIAGCHGRTCEYLRSGWETTGSHGGGTNTTAAGDLFAPHDIRVDSTTKPRACPKTRPPARPAPCVRRSRRGPRSDGAPSR